MHKPRNRKRRQGGFTLIEILVVVTIIGVLAGLVVVVTLYSGVRYFMNARGVIRMPGTSS